MQIRVLKNGKPIFNSIGNTKQEAEIDLLYQIVLALRLFNQRRKELI